MDKKVWHMVTFSLLLVGGINWGLVGLLNWNFVEWVFGYGTMLTKVVYVAVGISALWLLLNHQADCLHCGRGRK